MNREDCFHAGIVTDDADQARSTLTALLGYTWGDEMSVEQQVVLPGDREQTVTLTFAYSTNEPRLEIIRSIPGTAWEAPPGWAIHHLGYWSDDLPADGALLEAQGFRPEAGSIARDGGQFWTYHLHPGGARVELVSRALRPGMEGLWSSRSPS